MSLIYNYKTPVPIKWRKIGDSILLASSGLSTVVMGSPIPDHISIWIVFGLNIFGIAGKIITNFFTS